MSNLHGPPGHGREIAEIIKEIALRKERVNPVIPSNLCSNYIGRSVYWHTCSYSRNTRLVTLGLLRTKGGYGEHVTWIYTFKTKQSIGEMFIVYFYY